MRHVPSFPLRIAILCIIALLACTVIVQPASAKDQIVPALQSMQGSVAGQVVQGTEGAVLPERLVVGMVVMDDGTIVSERQGYSDRDGSFRFEQVEMLSGQTYGVYALYEGVYYSSERRTLEAPGEELTFTVIVYEGSAGVEDVLAEQVHFLIDVNVQGQLEITQVWLMTMAGDTSYVPGDPPVQIDLPEQLETVATLAEGEVYEQNGRLLLDLPIRAGEMSSIIVYTTLEPESDSLRLEMLFPVESAVFMTPVDGLMITGSGVLESGVDEYAGSMLQQYVRFDLQAGDMLDIRIMPAREKRDVVLLTAITGVVLILASVFISTWNQRRYQGKDEMVDLLTRTIADLDEAYAQGVLDEETYRDRREALMQQALDRAQKNHD